jgi:hypothetical protein
MMKKSIYFVLRSCVLASLATAFAASATQTVQPVKDLAGTAFSGSGTAWTGTAGLGTVVTVIGRYTTDIAGGNESGLGVKVVYDETKFTGVTVTALNTKCMIALPQIQPGGAATKAVMGWIDTAARNPAGSVGWPYLADPATASGPPPTSPCLSPNTPANDTTATATGAVNLFQFTGTLAAGVGVGGTATVGFVSDGNYSYAGTTPNMANQLLTITAAAAPTCNLDVDASGGAPTAGVDGILIKRALNAFLPAANITIGVTFPGTATRTVGADIRTYVTGLGNVLDVDGNGAAAPVAGVDGVLIQRALNTFIQTASITTGVTTTATGAQVRAYLNANCGTTLPP